MELQNVNNNFQGKWQKEKTSTQKKYRFKRKKSKSFILKLFDDIKKQFYNIKTELFSPSVKSKSKRSFQKKNDFRTLSNRSIIKKAFQNAQTDIKSIINSFKTRKKEVRRSEVLIQRKIKQRKRKELLNSIKNILFFRFLFNSKPKKISKDALRISSKLKQRKAIDFKKTLIRFSQFKFNSKKRSISERMHQRELKEKRVKQIKQLIIDIKSFPNRSIKKIKNTFKSILNGFINIKSKWNLLLLNIKRINQNQELKARFIYTYINSSLAFLTTYILIFFLNQLLTTFICSAYSIPTVLYYFDIIYQVGPYSSLWNRFNILLIYGSAPFFSLLLSVIFYQLFKISKNKFKYLRIYFLWGMINSFNLFFGAYIVGAITRTGFIYFTEWLFFSYMFDIEEIIFMVSCLITMVSIGYFSSDFFLSSADNRDLITFKNKPFYKFAQIFLPWLTGILILNIFNLPNITVYNLLLYASLLLIIMPAMVDYHNYKTQQIVIIKSKQKYTFLKWNLFVSFIIILLIRFVLNDGIWFN